MDVNPEATRFNLMEYRGEKPVRVDISGMLRAVRIPDEYVWTILNMSSTLTPLTQLEMPVDTDGIPYNGRTIYHDLTEPYGIILVTKGAGNVEYGSKHKPSDPNIPRGYPDNIQDLYFDDPKIKSHPRILGTQAALGGAMELVNTAAILSQGITDGNISPDELFSGGRSVPVAMSYLPLLSSKMLSLRKAYGGKALQWNGNDYLVQVACTAPSAQRILHAEYNDHDPIDFNDRLFFKRLVDEEVVNKMAGNLRRLVQTGCVYNVQSSHPQNLYFPSGKPGDFTDLVFLGDYNNLDESVCLIAAMLNRDIRTSHDTGEYSFGLFPPIFVDNRPLEPSKTDSLLAQLKFVETFLKDTQADPKRLKFIPLLLTANDQPIRSSVMKAIATIVYQKYSHETKWAEIAEKRKEGTKAIESTLKGLGLDVDISRELESKKVENISSAKTSLVGVNQELVEEFVDFLTGKTVGTAVSVLMTELTDLIRTRESYSYPFHKPGTSFQETKDKLLQEIAEIISSSSDKHT